MVEEVTRIIGVALLYPGGMVVSARKPARHHTLLNQGREDPLQKNNLNKCVQGFITNSYKFVTREEAYEIVISNGQLTKPMIGGVLTSEDLW
jgi:hypothetical protein